MNYESYQAAPSPAEIHLPSDGGSSPIQLSPHSGLQTATAQPADSPVTIHGVQMSAAQARELGYLNDASEAPMVTTNTDAQESPSDAQESPSEAPEEVLENTLEEGTAEVLEGLLSERGDLAMSVVNSVINDGNISEENLSDIATASGLSMEQAEDAFTQVSDHFDSMLDGNSSLLSLAAETDPQATKSAIVAGLHGDFTDAQRIIAATASTMDMSSASEGLIEALEENGYEVSTNNGRMYVSGHEFPVPQPWSRVYNLFNLSII